MYCQVEACIYNVSGTCGTDTEIDENGKCVWIECEDEPQKSCSTCGYSPQTPSCDTCEGYSNWWPLEDERQIEGE